jgi:hypothetical protein
MIRLTALRLAGCAVCAGLVLVDFGSSGDQSSSSETRLSAAQTKPAASQIRRLADPLFSPTQRRAEASSSTDDADTSLRDVRLTGVVIEPDRRIAIFAVSGAKPLVLSEGDTLKDWRLDSISPGKVLLSGPAGNVALEPKVDANLVRSAPSVEVQPGQVEPGVPPGAPLAAGPQPMAVTPIGVPVAIPVPVQSYPNYSPEYYAGYDQYYPPYSDYAYPYPDYLGYGLSVRARFGFGFFHHHDVHHGGFGFRSGAVHGGHR